MFKVTAALGLTFFAVASAGAQSASVEEGAYELESRNGKMLFSVHHLGQHWELRSEDADFPLNKIKCISGCNFVPMDAAQQQKLLPPSWVEMFSRTRSMSCIANAAFALCRISSKPLLMCNDPKLQKGDSCVLSPQPEGPAHYGLFTRLAAMAPLTVRRLGGG